MSILSIAHGTESAAFGALRKEASGLGERYRRWRLYRRSVVELSALSGHELADLGLSRSGIRSAAHDAVYGVN